jgi:NDP-sugar pyrophosphorylase family protein
MNKDKINILIPMAGNGQRFIDAGYKNPKFLIDILGKTMIERVAKSLNIDGNYIYIVQKKHYDEYNLENVLNSITPNCKIIKIEDKTDGAARTTLFAENLINNENPLIIFNSDQIVEWDTANFKNFINNKIDGAIVTFKATDSKWSYVKINNLNLIEEVAEKKQISDDATVGIYYWSKGSDYIHYAKKMIEKEIKVNNEFYVAPVYNQAILDNKKIFSFPSKKMWGVGTPEDLEIYISKQKEYYSDKPKTIFCDIDGTILKHVHGFSHITSTNPVILNGVIEKFNEWDSKGYKIILTTARKESARKITESHLNALGLCWDHLLMGMTSGQRVLINDKLYVEDQDRAIAINAITDGDFNKIDWAEHNI